MRKILYFYNYSTEEEVIEFLSNTSLTRTKERPLGGPGCVLGVRIGKGGRENSIPLFLHYLYEGVPESCVSAEPQTTVYGRDDLRGHKVKKLLFRYPDPGSRRTWRCPTTHGSVREEAIGGPTVFVDGPWYKRGGRTPRVVSPREGEVSRQGTRADTSRGANLQSPARTPVQRYRVSSRDLSCTVRQEGPPLSSVTPLLPITSGLVLGGPPPPPPTPGSKGPPHRKR